jgi:hypothetical protein
MREEGKNPNLSTALLRLFVKCSNSVSVRKVLYTASDSTLLKVAILHHTALHRST